MHTSQRFQPPTTAWRGKVANLRAAAQAHKPEHGEARSTMRCICGSRVSFTIMSNGLSWGQCSAACGVRWQQ